MYPFLGGDSVEQETEEDGNLIPSINLILPYVMPGFIRGASKEAVYDLSMVLYVHQILPTSGKYANNDAVDFHVLRLKQPA